MFGRWENASMRTRFSVFLVTTCLTTLSLAQSPLVSKPPATPKRPVTDEYQGIKVTDDYRWLENWDDPQTKQWSAAENARSREYLDHLTLRPAVKERLTQLSRSRSSRFYDLQFRGGMLFAMKYQPPQEQPMLVALPSADNPDKAKVIFDPNSASSKGSFAVDFYVPSLNGKYVAAAVSENGSEDSSGVIFEVASGRKLADVVPRVNFATAGGSIDWKADSSGFYYTRYPQGKERPAEDADFYQQVYFHKLGTPPAQDVYIIGKEFPRIAEIQLRTSDDGRWLVASVANGDGGQFEHYVMDASGHWTQVTHLDDGIVAVKVGPKDALYLLSRKDAPRGKILRLSSPDLPLSQATVAVPESSGSESEEGGRASIESFVPASGRLYVMDMMGGPSRVRVFDDHDHPMRAPPLPSVSGVDEAVAIGGGNLLFRVSTYLAPPAWFRFDSASGNSARTALSETSAFKLDDFEVRREFATSKDGTRVPLNILRRKGTKLDGSHPTLLYGYGGFDISESPRLFRFLTAIWLDQDGIFVDTNLRGGGEYGEEWHQAGKLIRKQNVFDDFIACAQYLIDHKYTSPQHLAIFGGSNGGLLMGAALTQQPDLFGAVVSQVGIYDMLRIELDPNGSFNTTEFGTVKDAAQFKALYAYSPYHHVKDGTAYPAILFMTGDNDHRVNPMQSRKMTARLQAASSSGRPILLRTSSTAGHGFGTAVDEVIEQDADVLTFLFENLGVRYTAGKK
jgi:prolyl oligopeptidase